MTTAITLAGVAAACGSPSDASTRPEVTIERLATVPAAVRAFSAPATTAALPTDTPVLATHEPSPTDEPPTEVPPEDTATAEPPAAPTPTTVPPVPVPTATVAPPPPVPPSRSVAGARVWSDGDSTSYFMSVAVIDGLAGLGAIPVQAAPEYQISSGLMNSSFFDWPAYIDSQFAALKPTIAVFMIGANDASASLPYDTYHERVGALMDAMRGEGRKVIWVGQPHMGREDLEPVIPGMNEIFRDEASKRPWVTYVDVYGITSAADGSYAAYLPDADGVVTLMRADDGVHFTPAGGRLLASRVLAAILGS